MFNRTHRQFNLIDRRQQHVSNTKYNYFAQPNELLEQLTLMRSKPFTAQGADAFHIPTLYTIFFLKDMYYKKQRQVKY
jgi:hypothetical protein